MSAAIVREDMAAVAGFYATDAAILPTRGEIKVGRDSILAYWQRPVQGGTDFTSHKVTAEHIAIGPQVVYEFGYYAVRTRNEDGSESDPRRGKYTIVWQKQTSGEWKIAVDAWSGTN